MKKILFAVAIVAIGFSACKKEDDTQPSKVKIEKKTMDGEEGGNDGKGSGDEGWGG